MQFSHILIFFELRHDFKLFILQVPSHHFSISFSKSSHRATSSSSLTRKFHSHSHNSWPHMLNCRQFNLKRRFNTHCMFSKNFKNQIDSISRNCPDFTQPFIELIDLRRFKNITNNQYGSSQSFHIGNNFFKFSFADIGRIIWHISFLKFFENDHTTIGIDKTFQLLNSIIQHIQ